MVALPHPPERPRPAGDGGAGAVPSSLSPSPAPTATAAEQVAAPVSLGAEWVTWLGEEAESPDPPPADAAMALVWISTAASAIEVIREVGETDERMAWIRDEWRRRRARLDAEATYAERWQLLAGVLVEAAIAAQIARKDGAS